MKKLLKSLIPYLLSVAMGFSIGRLAMGKSKAVWAPILGGSAAGIAAYYIGDEASKRKRYKKKMSIEEEKWDELMEEIEETLEKLEKAETKNEKDYDSVEVFVAVEEQK